MISNYLGIVDADSILYRVAAACEEEPLDVALRTLDAFISESIFEPTKCNKYIFCFTGKSELRRSYAVTKPYKGQRTVEKPLHLADLKAYCLEAYKGLIVEPHEADDVVIAIAQKYQGSFVLIGIDKDAKQLAGNHYNFVKKEHFTLTPLQAQEHLAYQLLAGDSVDNIPGLPKVGAVKAAKLFEENPDVPPMKLVYDMYKEKGLEWVYYEEQYKLLYMLRDILVPFEDYFVELNMVIDHTSIKEFDFE